MSVIEERLAKLDEITLASGGHSSFEDGVCAMEAVAWVAGEPHSRRNTELRKKTERLAVPAREGSTDAR